MTTAAMTSSGNQVMCRLVIVQGCRSQYVPLLHEWVQNAADCLLKTVLFMMH